MKTRLYERRINKECSHKLFRTQQRLTTQCEQLHDPGDSFFVTSAAKIQAADCNFYYPSHTLSWDQGRVVIAHGRVVTAHSRVVTGHGRIVTTSQGDWSYQGMFQLW